VKNKFRKVIKGAIEKSDVSLVPSKYLNINRNYNRISRVVETIKTRGLATGLDFGCAMCFCTVLGQLNGINITGLDIPNVGGLKPNGRPRRAGVSPYLSVQKNIQKLGYPVKIMDTTKFPWDFLDDEFEFIVMWYSFNKQQMDSANRDLEKRALELSRITKPNGQWFVHPASHIPKITQRLSNDKNISMVAIQ